MAEVEGELMTHILRNTERLDVVCKVEGRAKQHQRDIIIRCDVIVVLMHLDFSDEADLGVNSTTAQPLLSGHYVKKSSGHQSEHRTESV